MVNQFKVKSKLNRIFLMVLFFIMLYNSLLKAQDTSAIRIMLKEQEQSWNNGDLEKYMSYYWQSDSLRFITSKGITFGWQNTLEKYKKAYPDKKSMGILAFNLISIDKLNNENYMVIGKWDVITQEKKFGGYFTLILRNINGVWKIITDHTS